MVDNLVSKQGSTVMCTPVSFSYSNEVPLCAEKKVRVTRRHKKAPRPLNEKHRYLIYSPVYVKESYHASKVFDIVSKAVMTGRCACHIKSDLLGATGGVRSKGVNRHLNWLTLSSGK